MINKLSPELTLQIRESQAFYTIDYPLSAYPISLPTSAFEALKVENAKLKLLGMTQVNMYIAIGYEISHLKEMVVNATNYVVIQQIVTLRRYDPA